MTDNCHGSHPGFEMPPEDGSRFGLPGVTTDTGSISDLIGAAFDGCRPCQTRWLGVLQTDPLGTARLVELAAVATQAALGGLPSGMTTNDGPTTFTEPFRRLLRAGVAPADHTAMYQAARGMGDEQRRQALDDAVDVLIGHMTLGSG